MCQAYLDSLWLKEVKLYRQGAIPGGYIYCEFWLLCVWKILDLTPSPHNTVALFNTVGCNSWLLYLLWVPVTHVENLVPDHKSHICFIMYLPAQSDSLIACEPMIMIEWLWTVNQSQSIIGIMNSMNEVVSHCQHLLKNVSKNLKKYEVTCRVI